MNNVSSETSTAGIPVGQLPSSVAVTPDGSHAYVVGLIDGGIRRIETATNTLDPSKIEGHIGVGFSEGFAISSDGRLGYAADQSMGGLRVIDIENNTATDKWIMLNDSAPRAVAITPDPASVDFTRDGRRLLVVNASGIIDDTVSTISVINTATNKVVGSEVSLGLPAGTTALGIAIIDDEGDTCITCWDSRAGLGTIRIIPTLTILEQVP